MATRFGRAGAHVVLADADSNSGRHAVQMLSREGLGVSFRELDVRDPRQSALLVGALTTDHHRIDVWINNPGVIHLGPAESLSREQWDESIAIILSGSFYCSQAVSRQMLAQGRGVIMNIASVGGYKASEGAVAYCTAQAGLIMLTQSLGVEFAKRGVRVVGIAPGAVETHHMKGLLDGGLANAQDFKRRTPLHRLGTFDDVCDAALFLASEAASYITAEILRVDGGWVAYQLF
jgi:NAD(P)-dependent dehydrogenase (short-subunit alcohol dehydrogenase family)